jgi:hypothetical protein
VDTLLKQLAPVDGLATGRYRFLAHHSISSGYVAPPAYAAIDADQIGIRKPRRPEAAAEERLRRQDVDQDQVGKFLRC